MVHRDVKPSNVMLTLDGVTLIDFGVARAAEQSQLTRTGMVVGTPAYMSPEQAAGTRRLTGAVDVFALGSVVAFAACGRPPFGDESGHGVLYRIVHEQPDLEGLREADPELASVVASCLDKDPEGRPTAAELLRSAVGRAPSEPPLWPAALTERLTARAAFAAAVPEATVVDPSPAPEPEPTPGPASGPEVVVRPPVDGRRADRPRERRRFRALLVVVPAVVVVGTATLASQLLPYATDPGRKDTAGTPAASVSASADPAADRSPGSPTPDGTEKPGKKGSPSPSDKKKSDKGSSGSGGKEGSGASGGGSSGGSGGTGDNPGGSGSSGGSTGGSSGTSGGSAGGASGGSSSGGTSSGGSSSGGTSPGNPGSGTFRLKNGENGKCLIQVYGSTGLGDCSSSSARWTFRSAAGGSLKVVNVSSGACLSANGMNQAVFVGDCSQPGDVRLWRTGSGNSLRTVYDGGCLDLAYGGGVAEATCRSGASSQSWART
jgi:serine/threonine protein kinase